MPFAGAWMENAPFASVVVHTEDPFTTTVANGTPVPFELSETVPFTWMFWAPRVKAGSIARRSNVNNLWAFII